MKQTKVKRQVSESDLLPVPKQVRNDLSNRTIGEWFVLGWLGNGRWLCRCSCGVLYSRYGTQLKLSARCLRCSNTKRAIHGLYGDKLRPSKVWRSMILRCDNENCSGFKDYGGRGIKVCERWYSIVAFYEDMGPRPSVKHSIDRIDNDGNYEPGNCRWATQKEQALNKRTTKRLTINGITKTQCEWAEEVKVKSYLITNRLKSGWTVEEAVMTPINTKCINNRYKKEK